MNENNFKSCFYAKIATAKSLGDIAMDLTEIAAPRISKLVSVESKDQLIMASTGSLVSAGSADSEVSEELKKEKISELKKKEKNLQDLLTQKLNELKKICLREAELTGKLPKEYPLASGEKPPAIRKRIGTAFKLDDLFPYDADPHLRNLESRFALQQKIVEAAKKLANETELCKTVKKKRRRNYVDAMKRFQEIENEINDYRVKTGKVPTQRASLIISDLSSLSDSLNLEDELNFSAFLSLKLSFVKQCFNLYFRSNYAEVQDPYPYLHRDALSTHSSPYYPASKQPRDSRSMPPTPQLTRNAFSSIQLRCEDDAPHHFRQRSGSLESQSLYPSETDAPEPAFTIAPPARRSNSTEVLDDVSSHTSQSSSEYCAHSRARDRHRRRKGNVYANTGSMPNLAQNDAHCYGYQPRARPTTTAYYVTGYPCYPEPEPYMNGGGYVYENDMEGQYNVNPSYHTPAYPAHDPYGRGYGQDDMDNLSQNPYATLRQARNRPPSRNENSSRHMQKAMVAEHLRGWYNRNMGHKQAAYEYERVPQQSVAYRIAPSGYGFSDRATSYSSGEPFGVLMMSYVDVSQADTHMSSPVDSFDSEDQTLYWHEDSKPGTIV
uniref:FERM domain containing 4Ba n=1 Tax=Astyanax mexicanus TaxID=7994 RepID=A0A8B9H2E3_ASTMX